MNLLTDLYDNFLIYHTNTFFFLSFIFLCFFLIFSFFLSIKIFLFAIKIPKQILRISRKTIRQARNPLKRKRVNIDFPVNSWIKNAVKIYVGINKKIINIKLFFEKIGKAIAREIFIEE